MVAFIKEYCHYDNFCHVCCTYFGNIGFHYIYKRQIIFERPIHTTAMESIWDVFSAEE